MSLDDPATVEGDLQRTPFPHLLVYVAERRLTGTLSLREPSGIEHVVRFEWGAPTCVLPGDRYALFGELLVEAGICEKVVIDEALATKGLLGDVLILTGHADADALERVAALQLERRITRIFGLPPSTRYRWSSGDSAPKVTGVPGSRGDVLHLLAAGVRAHPRSAMPLARLMERLGEIRLALHPDAVLERFHFDDDEAQIAAALIDARPTFVDLLSAGVADADVIRRVVYLLLLTRHLDLGSGARVTPLGAEETPPSIAVGRVTLRAAMHRVGAAAPDPVGDGERAAVMPRTLRKRRAGPSIAPIAVASDLPPVDQPDPESDVREVDLDARDPESDVREVDLDARDPESDEREPVSDIVELGPGADGRLSARARDQGTGTG